ncbi:MAG: YqaA family protein [Holosporaceae bacterium]
MKTLQRINQKTLELADHPQTLLVFGFLSFLSGSLVPLPVDPLFLVLAIRRLKNLPLLILVGTLGVTLGGICMYFIGYGLYCTLGTWVVKTYNWQQQFDFLSHQLAVYGGWIIVLKAFTPIPYKLLALAAGMGHLNLYVFIIASLVGRALRFSIEGTILRFCGPTIQDFLQRHLSLGLGILFIGFMVLTLLVVFFLKL